MRNNRGVRPHDTFLRIYTTRLAVILYMTRDLLSKEARQLVDLSGWAAFTAHGQALCRSFSVSGLVTSQSQC